MKNTLFMLVCIACFTQTIQANQRTSQVKRTLSTAGIVVAPMLVDVTRSCDYNIVAPRYVDPTNSTFKGALGMQKQFGFMNQSDAHQKLRFRDRMAMNMLSKWAKLQRISAQADSVDADIMAAKSRKEGTGALVIAGLAVLMAILAIAIEVGWPLILVAIFGGIGLGVGIAAMRDAAKARKMGSREKDGRGTGLAAVITSGLPLAFLLVIIIAILGYVAPW